MSYKPSRRLAIVAYAATSCLGVMSPLTGCESAGLGSILRTPQAIDLLSPLVKNAAESYLQNLIALTSSLGDLNSLQGVAEFVKQIEPTLNQISAAFQTLSETTGEDRVNLLKAFGPEIDSANSGFLNQAGIANDNSIWKHLLSPALDQVALFQ